MSNTMSTERDYSLLRPFDLEAAKRGEVICFDGDPTKVSYIAGPDKRGNIICDVDGYFNEYFETALRMAPLCWVEGRPVYRGDVLWCRLGNRHVIVKVYGEQVWFESETWLDRKELTWTPPKVKREGWVNIYPRADFIPADATLVSHAFSSKEKADLHAMSRRIDCIRIEWEEVAK